MYGKRAIGNDEFMVALMTVLILIQALSIRYRYVVQNLTMVNWFEQFRAGRKTSQKYPKLLGDITVTFQGKIHC